MRNNPSSVPDMTRRPAVAGYFYPAEARALRAAVEAYAHRTAPPATGLAVIVPHGSYAHAGAIIGSTLARIAIPRRCIVLGPSHTGSWLPSSLMNAGAYRTPLGDVPIDRACADALQQRCPFLTPDIWGQHGEHAIEVVLPFLQHLAPADLQIVPIIFELADAEHIVQLAEALAQIVRMQEEPVLLIASSDLSHYATQVHAAEQDQRLLEAMTALDPQALDACILQRGINMCGYAATACVMRAAKLLEATSGTVAAYGTSVTAGGDPNSVIGYAGVVIA